MGHPASTLEIVFDLLVVDDNEEHSRLVAMILGGEDRRVWVAQAAADALELMRARSYAMAVFDIRMPDMDGIELATRLRQIAGDVPLVFLTAGQLEPDNLGRIYALASRRVLLAKPIQVEVLEAVAESILYAKPLGDTPARAAPIARLSSDRTSAPD